MIDDMVSAYLAETDCAIIEGRIYEINQKRDAIGRVNYRGLELGLSSGPKLKDLERNWLNQRPGCVNRLITDALESYTNNLNGVREASLNEVPIEKRVAYDTVCSYEFSDVLAPIKLLRDGNISSTALMKIIEEVFSCIPSDNYLRVFGKEDIVSLRGVFFRLKKDDDENQEDALRISVGKNRFVSKETCRFDLETGRELCEIHIKDSITSALEMCESLSSLRYAGISLSIEDTVNLPEFYSSSNNLGFRTVDRPGKEGLYVFTKTPDYVLFERKSKTYFKFPIAEVGVKLSRAGNRVIISNPVVMNRYKHPGISGINQEISNICFTAYMDMRKRINDDDPVDQIMTLLQTGCEVLMKNYRSAGRAFENLDKPDIREKFQDLIIDKERVVMSMVANLEACERAGG